MNKQIVSLYTSSPDESVGGQLSHKLFKTDLNHLSPSVFCDQEDWLEQVIKYFSGIANEAALIIRIHPRLAADHRGLPESPNLQALMSSLDEQVGTCLSICLIHPADPISSYWIGMQSNLILNGWSTIGLEFAVMGKIVANAFYKCKLGGGINCPVHVMSSPLKSSNNYFDRISRLLVAIKQQLPLNQNDYISDNEAIKALFVLLTAGCVDIANPSDLQSQIASPQVLTPQMLSLMITS